MVLLSKHTHTGGGGREEEDILRMTMVGRARQACPPPRRQWEACLPSGGRNLPALICLLWEEEASTPQTLSFFILPSFGLHCLQDSDMPEEALHLPSLLHFPPPSNQAFVPCICFARFEHSRRHLAGILQQFSLTHFAGHSP